MITQCEARHLFAQFCHLVDFNNKHTINIKPYLGIINPPTCKAKVEEQFVKIALA
jgi:hypothetical protein